MFENGMYGQEGMEKAEAAFAASAFLIRTDF
jgi:hypothetical protein